MSRRRTPFAGARPSQERRPDYDADRKRRRAFVRQHLRDNGQEVDRGVWLATCQVCGQVRALPLSDWWADHIHVVARGGSEHGPLRLSCKLCQLKQGSTVANERNPLAQSRKRAQEQHPGAVLPE